MQSHSKESTSKSSMKEITGESHGLKVMLMSEKVTLRSSTDSLKRNQKKQIHQFLHTNGTPTSPILLALKTNSKTDTQQTMTHPSQPNEVL